MNIPVNINVNDTNPWLFVDADSLGTDRVNYFIAGTTNQLPEGNWVRVNQFCSILSVLWLQNPKTTFGFPSLSTLEQQQSAQTLIGFESLESQVQYAAEQLGGTQITLEELNAQLSGYAPGAQIWFGNDVHVMAALVQSDSSLLVYDSNTGQTETMTESQFLILLGNLGINAIVVRT